MTTAALSIDHLCKTFDVGFLGALPGAGRLAARLQIRGIAQRVDAVKGLSFDVQPGEIFGFLGPNGAGKTTTIKMLMGLIRPSSGSGFLLGEPLGSRHARARLGFLPEHPYFYEYLKPVEFLDFYARLFSMTAGERKKRCMALIDRVGLSHALNRPLRKFSKGMIQRIGVAQALINDPDLVVLDEPMSGLDPMGRKDVRDIILDLKARGKTVFFSSHILQDVEMICDRVAIVIQGQLRSLGPLTDLLKGPLDKIEVTVSSLSPEGIEALQKDAAGHHLLAGGVSFMVGEASKLDAFIDRVHQLGGHIQSVTPQHRSLEDLFVEEARRNA